MDLALQGFGDSFIAIYKVTNTTGDTGYLLLIQRSGAWCRGNREERNRRGRQRSVGPQRRRRLRQCTVQPPEDAVRRSTRGSGIRAGIRQGGMGTERTRREKPWCDAGAMLLRYGLKFAGPSRRAELLPRLGLPALGSHHKIFYFLSYSSKVSLGYFHLESFNRVSC